MPRSTGPFWIFVGFLCAAGVVFPILVSHDFRELTGAAVSNLLARSHWPRLIH
jgi:hypothetical protein